MPQSVPSSPPAHRSLSPLAGLLSYLVPGLGQIYQGRVGKGLLFFICLYGMFFLGMYLGSWSNVYMLNKDDPIDLTIAIRGVRLPPIILTGWKASLGHRPQFASQFWIGIAAWPAIWQYNHYDERAAGDPLFGNFQRTPKEEDLNDLQKSGNKLWDLAWVYTVIAGVLNILVIYDAFAGPVPSGSDEAQRTT